MMHTWLLPEYIEDVLPAEAQRIETTRRRLLDLFRLHGYQLVMPPLLEYVESLLTGTGHEMDIKTFKLVDQISGRLMGLRADITPQVARIDAHLLNRQGVTRLCYAGSVLHTLPAGVTRTREPLQIGAELYGHAGLESDMEIQQLMLKALQLAGVEAVHLDLGHVAIFGSLIKYAGVPAELESELFRALQAKDVPAVQELARPLENATRQALALLPELYGGAEVLDVARRKLPDYPEIARALSDLGSIAEKLQGAVVSFCFDLAELRGYHYHSGVVFAAYAPGWANAVALGGRYDEVGVAFGRARPATGFSMDLREISAALPVAPLAAGILAPHVDDQALRVRIDALRAAGEMVVVDLPGHAAHRGELGCDRALQLRDGTWKLVKVEGWPQ
jgi:ATP phosphoribosyltransferase regulatory subunit